MNQLQQKLKDGSYLFPKHIPISLEAVYFMDSCLQYHTYDRISMDELVDHNYFKISNQPPIPFNAQDLNNRGHSAVEITNYN